MRVISTPPYSATFMLIQLERKRSGTNTKGPSSKKYVPYSFGWQVDAAAALETVQLKTIHIRLEHTWHEVCVGGDLKDAQPSHLPASLPLSRCFAISLNADGRRNHHSRTRRKPNNLPDFWSPFISGAGLRGTL